MKKKIFWILLITMALTLSGISFAYAADSGSCGTNLRWTLDSNGNLSITGSGDMKNYVDGGDGNKVSPWYWSETVKTITIGSGVTSIGDYAFLGCMNAVSIQIPNSVKSIGQGAFQACKALASISIPASVESVGEDAFEYCESLPTDQGFFIGNGVLYKYIKPSGVSRITIPEGVTRIESSAFKLCRGFTSVTIPDSVVSIGIDAFSGTSLTQISIPDSVQIIDDYAFSSCSQLRSVSLPDHSVYLGEGVFKYCDKLLDENGLIIVNNIVYGSASTLTDVVIPDSVTGISGSAFLYHSSLKTIRIPGSVQKIGDRAFSSCKALSEVTILDGVREIGESCFSKCSSLIAIEMPDSITSIGSEAFASCTALDTVTIPAGVTEIRDKTFQSFTSSQKIMIHKNVTSVPGGAVGSATIYYEGTAAQWQEFHGYSWNVFVQYKSWKLADGVLEIYASFDPKDSASSYCWNRSTNAIEAIHTVLVEDGVSAIGAHAFSGFTALTSVSLPKSLTSIGNYAFQGCTSLSCLTIPDGVTQIGDYAFKGCTALASLTIPKSVTQMNSNALNGASRVTVYYEGTKAEWDLMGGSSFSNVITQTGKWSLQGYELTIKENFDMSDLEDGHYAPWYKQRNNIQKIILQEGITCLAEDAFRGYSQLKEITIPDTVTRIDPSSFYDCSSLTSITIPESVISIGSYAFHGCSQLTELIIPETVKSFGSYCFGDISVLKCYKYSPADIWLQKNRYENRIQYLLYDPASCEHRHMITQEAHAPNYAHTGLTEGLYCDDCGTVFMEQKIIPKLGTISSEMKTLQTLELPESLTMVEAEAFSGSSIEAVIIPENCRYIGSKAFANCPSLKYVMLKSDSVQIESDAFKESDGVMVVRMEEDLKPLVSVNGSMWIHELFGKTIKQANLLIDDELVAEEDFYLNSYFGVQTDEQGRINYISLFNGTKYSLFSATIGQGIRATAYIGGCGDQYNWQPYNSLAAPPYMTSEYYPDRIIMLTWNEKSRLTSITYGVRKQ